MAWWKMCVPKNQGGMGFRDIHCFNLAMLAKQAWRIIENSDSLCATVLRAKYFPNGDLLNTKLKRALLLLGKAGVNCLNLGYIWRVGNGHNIDIWEDAWIPNCANRKVITPRGSNLISRVSYLIDPVTSNWDENLVTQMFLPVDAQRILAILLAQHDMLDFVAWSY